MNTQNITLTQFIQEHGLSMKAESCRSNPNMDSEQEMDHWLCKIANEGEKMAVYFSTGLGLRKDPDEAKALTYEKWATLHFGLNHKATQNPAKLRAQYATYLAARKYPVAPSISDVLDCLAMDAVGIENARGSFDDWCAEYGYDTDSRKAEKTFHICERQAAHLKHFLGAELFEQLLWNTDRE